MPIQYDATPPESWPNAKRVVALILSEAGGVLRQKTRLYKAFFRAHQEHWLHHDGLLTTHRVVAMTYGPGIDDGECLLQEMADEGIIRITPPPLESKQGFEFRLLRPESASGSESEKDSVRRALAWVTGRGAKWLSEETHKTSRSWIAAKQNDRMGSEMDIYLDLIPEGEYKRMGKAINDQKRTLESIFASDC